MNALAETTIAGQHLRFVEIHFTMQLAYPWVSFGFVSSFCFSPYHWTFYLLITYSQISRCLALVFFSTFLLVSRLKYSRGSFLQLPLLLPSTQFYTPFPLLWLLTFEILRSSSYLCRKLGAPLILLSRKVICTTIGRSVFFLCPEQPSLGITLDTANGVHCFTSLPMWALSSKFMNSVELQA